MKILATLALMTWAITTQAAPTCTNGGTTFTKLEGDYAHLTVIKHRFLTENAIYKMVFRPTRLSIWDLDKIEGEGPQTLEWQEQIKVHTIGCPRCAIFERTFKEVGVLTNDNTTICETEL